MVVLAGMESTILFVDEEERECLRGVRWMDLSIVKVFLEEVLLSFVFIRRERVDLPDFRGEGVVEVDFVIIGSGWWTWSVASLKKTEAKSVNSRGRICLGFAFSAAAASLVAVVILAIFPSKGDPL